MSSMKGARRRGDDDYDYDDYVDSSSDDPIQVNVVNGHEGNRGHCHRRKAKVVYLNPTGQEIGGEISEEYEDSDASEAYIGNQQREMEEGDSEEVIQTHITDEDISDGIHDQEYYVTIKGSLNDFGEIEGLSEWKAHPGNEHIYQPLEVNSDGDLERTGDVTKGLILDTSWIHVHSTAPEGIDIGLNISGVEGNVHTARGETFSIIVPGGGRTVVCGRSCFKPKGVITRNALENHRICDTANIGEDVIRQSGKSWGYVKRSSVIINLLKSNQGKFDIKLRLPSDPEALIKVPNHMIDTCISYLESKQNIPVVDFNHFTVTSKRIDGEAWDSTKNVIDDIAGHDQEEQSRYETVRMDNKFTVTGLLLIRKGLLPKEKPRN